MEIHPGSDLHKDLEAAVEIFLLSCLFFLIQFFCLFTINFSTPERQKSFTRQVGATWEICLYLRENSKYEKCWWIQTYVIGMWTKTLYVCKSGSCSVWGPLVGYFRKHVKLKARDHFDFPQCAAQQTPGNSCWKCKCCKIAEQAGSIGHIAIVAHLKIWCSDNNETLIHFN